MAVGPYVYDSWNMTPKKMKKNAIPTKKPPPLWCGSGFFLKKDIIMHSLLNKCKKTHFLN